jgi:hypothetical protein
MPTLIILSGRENGNAKSMENSHKFTLSAKFAQKIPHLSGQSRKSERFCA